MTDCRNDQFTFRRCGSIGCELLDPTGSVFAWTVNVAWAAVMTEMLNDAIERCAISGAKPKGE